MKVYELVGYIEVELKKGVGRAVITKNLLQQGWNRNDIDKAFSLIDHPLENNSQNQYPTSNTGPILWHVRRQPNISQVDILKQNSQRKSFILNRLLILVFLTIIVIIGDIVFFQSSNTVARFKTNIKLILTKIDSKNVNKYTSLLNLEIRESPTMAPFHPALIPITPSISNPNALLQLVNNVGYSIYLAQIDYPNAPPISDDTKNQITMILYNAKFPKKLLTNVAIVLVNTLAINPKNNYVHTVTQGQRETLDTQYPLPPFSPDFLTGGGIYNETHGSMSFIYINSKKLNSYEYINNHQVSDLTIILTHELGHHVASQLTDAEWTKYYQLRNIPSNTPRYGGTWELCPFEDFAEVYKNTFTGLPIQTYYGLIKNNTCYGTDPCNSISKNEAASDPAVQACWRDVLQHPEKYSISDFNCYPGTPPFYSSTDQASKDFIMSVINRLQ